MAERKRRIRKGSRRPGAASKGNGAKPPVVPAAGSRESKTTKVVKPAAIDGEPAMEEDAMDAASLAAVVEAAEHSATNAKSIAAEAESAIEQASLEAASAAAEFAQESAESMALDAARTQAEETGAGPQEIPVEDLTNGMINALGNGLGHAIDASKIAASGAATLAGTGRRMIAMGAKGGVSVAERLVTRIGNKKNA